MKIKVREITEGCMPSVIKGGEWIDLRLANNVELAPSQSGVLNKATSRRNVTSEVTYLPLGVAMQLPKGFEALVLPRSSTPKKFGIVMANSTGVIDNSYCGDNDEWKFPAIAIRETSIEQGARICQFRVQLSQKATIWQKIKWLFDNKIELVKVDSLNNVDRGGFGSTGTN